jgi:hypothetical protein
MILSPTQSEVQTALRSFILSVVGSIEVRTGNASKVAPPQGQSYVLATVLRMSRLSTNGHAYSDVVFTGGISAGVMTVTDVARGLILEGANIFGVDIPDFTTIVKQLTGDAGGIGTYQVSASGLTIASETISAGGYDVTMSSQFVFQVDFHSLDNTASDMAQAFSAVFRDGYATDFFEAQAAPLNKVSPLFADDPRMHPFYNGEELTEWAFIVEANLQVNQSVRLPMQYADAVTIGLYNVDFPPST